MTSQPLCDKTLISWRCTDEADHQGIRSSICLGHSRKGTLAVPRYCIERLMFRDILSLLILSAKVHISHSHSLSPSRWIPCIYRFIWRIPLVDQCTHVCNQTTPLHTCIMYVAGVGELYSLCQPDYVPTRLAKLLDDELILLDISRKYTKTLQ